MKHKLSPNIEVWPQEIMNFVNGDYQFLMPYISRIFFKKINAPSGVAMGAIYLTNESSGMEAVVPVMVNEFSMAPLDIFSLPDDSYVPLTPNRLSEYMGVSSGKLKRRSNNNKGAGEMPVRTDPPNHGTGGYFGGGRTISKESMFSKSAGSLGMGPGVLKIIMDSFPKKSEAVANRISSIVSNLPERAVWVRHYGGDWEALMSDKSYRTRKLKGRKEILEKLEKFDPNIGREMNRKGEVFIAKSQVQPMILEDMYHHPSRLTSSGVAAVILGDSGPRIGSFCPDATDLLGNEVGLSLWFDGELFAIAEEMSGFYMRDSFPNRTESIKKGGHYLFSFDRDGKRHVTLPFRVIADPGMGEDGNSISFKATNHYGSEVVIKYTKDSEVPVSNYTNDSQGMNQGQVIYIPTSWKLHKAGSKKTQISYVTPSNLKSVIRGKMKGVVVVSAKENGDGTANYYIKGDSWRKLVTKDDPDFDPSLGKSADSISKIIWYLMNYGLGEGGARMVINSCAQHDGEVTVGNLRPINDASVSFNLPSEITSLAENGVIPEDSIESILGLGFLDELDVAEAATHIDELRYLEGLLSKILFYVRMGTLLANEHDVSKAIEYVSRVVDQMEEFKSTNKNRK